MNSDPHWNDRVPRDCLCNVCRARLADLLYDAEPQCVGCADDLLDRETALSIWPDLRSTLPRLTDR